MFQRTWFGCLGLSIAAALLAACGSGGVGESAEGNEAAERAALPLDKKAADLPDGGADAAPAPNCLYLQRGVLGDAADTFIAGDPSKSGKNWGQNTNLLAGSVNGGERDTLIQFDLSPIPAGAQITSATLSLRGSISGDPNAMVRAHQILASWSEGTATFASFANAYDPNPAATAPASGQLSLDLTAMAQGWMSDPSANHGVLIEEDQTGLSSFRSSEWPAANDRPRLTVCFTGP